MNIIDFSKKLKERDDEILRRRAIKKRKVKTYKALLKSRKPKPKKKKINVKKYMKAIKKNSPYK